MCCCLITWFMPSSRFALCFRRMTTRRSKWPSSAYASGTALLFGLASSAGLGDGFLMVRRVSCAHNMPAVASTAPSSLVIYLLVMVSILSRRSGTGSRGRSSWVGCADGSLVALLDGSQARGLQRCARGNQNGFDVALDHGPRDHLRFNPVDVLRTVLFRLAGKGPRAPGSRPRRSR